ncbi:MAG: ABC transporter substrate-binding protein, partial [Blastocatellia bacterium]
MDSTQVIMAPTPAAPRSYAGKSRSAIALFCGLSVLLVLGCLTSCRRGGKPGVLVIAIEQPPRGFDPRLSSSNSQSAHIMQLIYDTLMVKDDHFNLVPSLADRFSQSPDSTTFTFHLRNGVKFHNGAALTSADVKYTFESILSPVLKSPIRGALDKIASIETPDSLTVVFKAREPFYTFLGNLPAVGIIPRDAGADIINHPIGSGPYRFVSYSEEDGVKLSSNEEYWGGAPPISTLEVEVIQDNSTRQAALMSGEIDLAYNAQFDPETIRALRRWSKVNVVVGPGSNIAHLGVNVTAPALSNPKVRQAIAYAINREEIIHKLLRDQARRADSILPPEQWAYDPNVHAYSYDPAAAEKLLDEGGFAVSGSGTRFTIEMMTTTNQLSRNIASIMQDQLRRVGIALNLVSLEPATFFDRLARGQFDLYYLISVGGNQSTDIFQFVYHSRYHDEKYNEDVTKLRSATNPAVVRTLLDSVKSILARRGYCADPEVNRLAAQAADSIESDPSMARQLYLRIAGLLT